MTHAYTVEGVWHEPLTVFAESFDQAATIYVTYRVLQGQDEPEQFSIGRAARGITDERQREHMRVALHRREVGIGQYDPAHGWRVLPVIDADQEGSGAPWDTMVPKSS
jgi:hypothetical protein